MKTKDIVIGQKYSHTDFPNTVYIGIGIQSRNGTKVRKALLIQKGGNNYMTCITYMVNSEWGSKFYPLTKQIKSTVKKDIKNA
jgi:hypothetical protein